jgi:hypothetical protein
VFFLPLISVFTFTRRFLPFSLFLSVTVYYTARPWSEFFLNVFDDFFYDVCHHYS